MATYSEVVMRYERPKMTSRLRDFVVMAVFSLAALRTAIRHAIVGAAEALRLERGVLADDQAFRDADAAVDLSVMRRV